MLRLFGIIYGMAGPTLAGSAIVAALVMGKDTAMPIVAAAALGAVAALPISWLVAKRITESTR